MKPSVLIAEDESALVTLLRYNLEREGYRVLEARDGEEALLVAAEEQPDLVLLDWMLPQLSGIEVCRRLRGRQETRNVPIIMLTARGEESDRIRGLDTGADDYLTKPFSMTELLARLRAVMRRIRPSLAEDVIAIGDIEMDRAAHRVRRGGKEVHLGPTEYKLLDHLIQHPGRVFSREQLLDAVWGSRRLCRGPHRRRPCRPPAQGAQRRRRERPDPHRALRRLLARRHDRGVAPPFPTHHGRLKGGHGELEEIAIGSSRWFGMVVGSWYARRRAGLSSPIPIMT